MTKSKESAERKRRNIITTILCFAGIILNLLFCRLCEATGIPLYLDTVGTIAASVMGGSLPGVIIGFFTNIFKSFSDSSSLYYGALNVLIALVSSWLAKKGFFRSPIKIVMAVVILSLIGGGLGTLIPWYTDGISFDSESLSAVLYNTGVLNQQGAQLTANLLIDFADKTITVAIVLIMMKLIPEKAQKLFSFTGWLQTPLSNEESAAARKTQFRIMSLRTKILIVLSASLAAVSIAATGICIHLYKNALIKDHTKLAGSTAQIAAGLIDPDKVDDYISQGANAEGYNETMKLLEKLRNSSINIQYIYVYKILPDGCHVVFDVDTEERKGLEAGSVEQFDESFAPYIDDLIAGKEIGPIISDDTYGWLLTIYQPVYDSSGKCVCYAAADVSMDRIGMIERSFIVEMLSLFMGFFILIFVIIRWLIEYHIILPVNSIAMSTGTFAYDTEKARENSIERIHELNIHTGDEVENLYHAIAKTSDDSMRYVADVQQKTEELAQMQNALIMVLADIVESRDKNTGAHVRKTAAYTEIILDKMKEKGYYGDILTDKFISDVVNSAPLHDVGKIQVPDAILNKPGKLTDEEFEIMKQHTIAGQDIISQAIDLVPNSGYLTEARNLTAYHHEKWDGSGYPYGIAGEEIPLSARVMAVADVFDALVSRRSYKEPMPYEKAVQIIRDGAGKHFDPLIVDAFVSADEAVRKVEKEFSELSDEKGWFDHKKAHK
ncbi:MAG TPA: HD domain-containing protein [Ruminococcus flavefaciens]|nr:HD domain-containing protein [Ruminococcus flavefaciens]HQM00895.1 HD domain-containing protein [Ruminococcus flavefaciens]